MSTQAIFVDVMSTPSDQIGELPDAAILTAALYAVEHDETLAALMLGVEIGLRQSARGEGEPSLLEALGLML